MVVDLNPDEGAALIALTRAEIAARSSKTPFVQCLELALAKLEHATQRIQARRSRSQVTTLPEIAKKYGVTEPWLRKFIKRERIPVLLVGRRIRFDATAVQALEKALRRPSGPIVPVHSGRSLRSQRGSSFEWLMAQKTSGSRSKRLPPAGR